LRCESTEARDSSDDDGISGAAPSDRAPVETDDDDDATAPTPTPQGPTETSLIMDADRDGRPGSTATRETPVATDPRINGTGYRRCRGTTGDGNRFGVRLGLVSVLAALASDPARRRENRCGARPVGRRSFRRVITSGPYPLCSDATAISSTRVPVPSIVGAPSL
jgi:hypothetical protein